MARGSGCALFRALGFQGRDVGPRYSLHRLKDILKIYWRRGYRNNRTVTCNFEHLPYPVLFVSCINVKVEFQIVAAVAKRQMADWTSLVFGTNNIDMKGMYRDSNNEAMIPRSVAGDDVDGSHVTARVATRQPMIPTRCHTSNPCHQKNSPVQALSHSPQLRHAPFFSANLTMAVSPSPRPRAIPTLLGAGF